MKTEVICGNCNKINIKRKKTNFYGIPTYECINDCKYHKLDEQVVKTIYLLRLVGIVLDSGL